MPKVRTIKTAEIAIGHNNDVLKTGSLGSCLAIILYDPKNHIGGLAHAMLPRRKGEAPDQPRRLRAQNILGKYVTEAIDHLVAAIRKRGGQRENIIAKLVGGASMFRKLSRDKYGIGFQNIIAAHRRLAELGIPIESEDTGGKAGKLVHFNLASGLVEVITHL